MVKLTPQERDKFALWLRQEAEGNGSLVEQMEKIPGGSMDPFIKMKKSEIAACMIVANILDSTESVTL